MNTGGFDLTSQIHNSQPIYPFPFKLGLNPGIRGVWETLITSHNKNQYYYPSLLLHFSPINSHGGTRGVTI
ncbi:hypothetical protein CMV_018283 [Castanea mollissima]|uniref:Uncharacterized protein n=1 Tax=Castanea mollissima TaxID=60419 RepID=A0A8J4R2N3_9ROSI|nr:hypothetical protein CMV_018283 [Castanea mollissima]